MWRLRCSPISLGMSKHRSGAKVGAKHAVGAGATRWEFSPTQWWLALLPTRIGTKDAGGELVAEVEHGKPVLITGEPVDAATRKRVYEALLELPWLTPEIRAAVFKGLGRSRRTENDNYGRGWTMAMRHMVDEVEARMRANGERPPRGDIRTAAIEEIAEKAGIESEALRRRIQRLSADIS
jgi:hypothetical protein